MHVDESSHLVVLHSAKLGAGYLEVAHLQRVEQDVYLHPGDRVLLNPEVGEEERVQHVLGRQADLNLAADWDMELIQRDDIIRSR